MTRMVLLLVAFVVSALPLQAAPIVFTASLDGPSESPSNASPGTGFAIVTIDEDTDLMRVQVTFAVCSRRSRFPHSVINWQGPNTATPLSGATTTPPLSAFRRRTFDIRRNFDCVCQHYRPCFSQTRGTPELYEAALLRTHRRRAYLNIHTTCSPAVRFVLLQRFRQPPTRLLFYWARLAVA